MNDKNLITFTQRSESEAKKIGKKGGIASGEARRARKTSAEIAKALGDLAVSSPQLLDTLKKMGVKKDDADNRTAFIARLYAEAIKGNVRAAHELLDLMGETNNVHVKGDINTSVTVLSHGDAMRQLYRPFSQTYQDFFYRNKDSRHVLLQGGRRSGKTQATFRHLLRLGEAMHDNLKVLVSCGSFPQLEKTIEDFRLICPGVEIRSQTCETAGLHWQFASFDDYTKAQGSQCDYLFINEAVNMADGIAEVLYMGARRQCFYNYNPTKASWVTSLVNADGSNMIKTTFKDNEYLPAEQVAEFERLKERALSPTATLRDRYMYQVYYLGDFARLSGLVFTNMERCTTTDYLQVQATECFGLDFGFATDGDPTVLVGVKVFGENIYVREYIYRQGLTSDVELINIMLELGITDRTPVSADYGGNGRQRILHCRGGAGVTKGMNFINAIKPKVIDNIGRLLTFEHIYVTDTSISTIAELEGYEIDNDKPKGADHAIDAMRYAFNYAERL